MSFRERFKPSRFRHAEGESGQDFLARVAESEIPVVPYADVLRWPVMELCRQVTVLHREIEALRTRVADLESRE